MSPLRFRNSCFLSVCLRIQPNGCGFGYEAIFVPSVTPFGDVCLIDAREELSGMGYIRLSPGFRDCVVVSGDSGTCFESPARWAKLEDVA